MQDLKEYGEQELSLVVNNDEALYNAFEVAEDFDTFMNYHIDPIISYTEDQRNELESEFEIPEIVEHKEKLQEIIDNDGGLRGAVAEWFIDELESYESVSDILNDLMTGGCQSGFVGMLTFYNQTIAFHDEHEDAIWDLAEEQKDEIGHENVIQFINSLNGANNVESMAQLKNLLSWFAFEETARNICINDLEIQY